jgi:mxaK protein
MTLQAIDLYRMEHENAWISALSSNQEVSVDKIITAAPQVRLARALFYQRQHRYDEALATLSLIMDKGDSAFQTSVRYNLGNLYLQRALEQIEAKNTQAAQPLVALAKQAYRQALALNSHFWDAKYNLELAMHLFPEMDRLNLPEQEAQTPPPQLWTTIPGFPRGLP